VPDYFEREALREALRVMRGLAELQRGRHEPVTVPAAPRGRGRPPKCEFSRALRAAGPRLVDRLDVNTELFEQMAQWSKRWAHPPRAAAGRSTIASARAARAAWPAARRDALRAYVLDRGHLSISNLAGRLQAAEVAYLAENLQWSEGVDRWRAAWELKTASTVTLRRDIAAIRKG